MDYCTYSDCKYYTEDPGTIGYKIYEDKIGICRLHIEIDNNLIHTSKCEKYKPKLINRLIKLIKYT